MFLMELRRCYNCRRFWMGTAARKLYYETFCSAKVSRRKHIRSPM